MICAQRGRFRRWLDAIHPSFLPLPLAARRLRQASLLLNDNRTHTSRAAGRSPSPLAGIQARMVKPTRRGRLLHRERWCSNPGRFLLRKGIVSVTAHAFHKFHDTGWRAGVAFARRPVRQILGQRTGAQLELKKTGLPNETRQQPRRESGGRAAAQEDSPLRLTAALQGFDAPHAPKARTRGMVRAGFGVKERSRAESLHQVAGAGDGGLLCWLGCGWLLDGRDRLN